MREITKEMIGKIMNKEDNLTTRNNHLMLVTYLNIMRAEQNPKNFRNEVDILDVTFSKDLGKQYVVEIVIKNQKISDKYTIKEYIDVVFSKISDAYFMKKGISISGFKEDNTFFDDEMNMYVDFDSDDRENKLYSYMRNFLEEEGLVELSLEELDEVVDELPYIDNHWFFTNSNVYSVLFFGIEWGE